jgi:membrane fusion protein (multidrug efflux system)
MEEHSPEELKKQTDEKQHAEHEQAKKNKRKRKRLLIRLAILFLILGLLYAVYWLIWARFEEYTDDAYMAGNLVRLMPQISGTITSVNTDDTEFVQQGQVLIKLDDSDTRIALERTAAALADTVRSVRNLYENVWQAEAQVILREADLEKATLDLKRRQGLVGEKAISREEMQHYLTAFEAAEQQANYARSKFNTALAQVQNTTLYNHPKVEHAKAVFKDAFLNFQRTTILSPVTGYVAKRGAQVGQQVTPGTALMAIVPLDQVWVEANYKETQLQRLRIGQPVEIVVDAYSHFTYHGHVHGLGAGTGSTFDLLPPQNATGNWIKIVQRLPVKIDLDPKEVRDHPLRLGLSVRVTTSTHHLDGSVLSKTPNDKVRYDTVAFNQQLATADQVIDSIVRSSSPDIPAPNQKPLPI